jgi:hypothetical protein
VAKEGTYFLAGNADRGKEEIKRFIDKLAGAMPPGKVGTRATRRQG